MNSPLPIGKLVLDPILPLPLVGVIGALLLFLTLRVYLRVGTGIGSWRNFTLLLFRILGIVLVLILLLQPSRQEFIPPPNKERITVVAVDSSLSMKQRDVARASRMDAAKNLLQESGVVAANGLPENARLRLFEFDTDAGRSRNQSMTLRPKANPPVFIDPSRQC